MIQLKAASGSKSCVPDVSLAESLLVGRQAPFPPAPASGIQQHYQVLLGVFYFPVIVCATFQKVSGILPEYTNLACRYMSEQEMLEIASRFSPYRCVYPRLLPAFHCCVVS